MSLYNLVFGQNANAGNLLEILGKDSQDFGRFRDVFVENGYIVVYTRCGGGNREYNEEVFEEMANHPWYSHDEDDDYDCTYCSFYFTVPEGVYTTLVGLLHTEGATSGDEKWKDLISSLESKEA